MLNLYVVFKDVNNNSLNSTNKFISTQFLDHKNPS